MRSRRPQDLRGGALALLAIAIASPGCSTTPARLGPDPRVPYDESRGRAISSAECGLNLGGVIGLGTPSVFVRAVTSLRAQAPFDYITNVEMRTYWRYAFIGSRHCVLLRATAYPKLAGEEARAAPVVSAPSQPEP